MSTPYSNHTPTARRTSVMILLCAAAVLASCSLPTVNLGTPDPIKVDVSMRLNVYQYRGDEPGKPSEEEKTYEEAVERQRNRMGEIQTIKDNRFVGEDHRGLLHLREKPAGNWGASVEKAVKDENEDRMILMRHEVQQNDRALHDVQTEQWKLRTANAYKGEWIEVTGDKPDTYKWKQAEGVKTKKDVKDEAKKDSTPAKEDQKTPAPQ